MNEPTTGLSQNPGCLRCHQLDKFERVEAVIRSERSTGVVRGRVPGRFGYDVPVSATVVQTSALAQDLARPVMPRSATWPAQITAGAARHGRTLDRINRRSACCAVPSGGAA